MFLDLLCPLTTLVLRHRPLRECTLPEPEEADRPCIDNRDYYHLVTCLQQWERIRCLGLGAVAP